MRVGWALKGSFGLGGLFMVFKGVGLGFEDGSKGLKFSVLAFCWGIHLLRFLGWPEFAYYDRPLTIRCFFLASFWQLQIVGFSSKDV